MIGIAAVFGAVSIFVADYWLKSSAASRVEQMSTTVQLPTVPAVEFGTVVVAAQPLRYGMTLEPALLTEIPWPQASLPAGAFPKIEALLADGSRVVLSPMEPNEPVLLAKLSGPNGRASLSNLLAPGMRAVTIKTDEIAGVGGFVTPGDRVDIVLTRDSGQIAEVEGTAQGAAGSTLTSEVVLENIKILSVGQGADERQATAQIATSVTLEVDADGAQKIALARNIGSLSLSLRSAGEGGVGADGLTTISAFGGSVKGSADSAISAIVERVSAPDEGPKMRTITVTRGAEAPQSYEVLSPGN